MIIYTYAKKGQIVPDWNVPEKYKLVVFCAKEVEVPKTWYKSIVKPLIDDEEVAQVIHNGMNSALWVYHDRLTKRIISKKGRCVK